jgi:hypothetical protein
MAGSRLANEVDQRLPDAQLAVGGKADEFQTMMELRAQSSSD